MRTSVKLSRILYKKNTSLIYELILNYCNQILNGLHYLLVGFKGKQKGARLKCRIVRKIQNHSTKDVLTHRPFAKFHIFLIFSNVYIDS